MEYKMIAPEDEKSKKPTCHMILMSVLWLNRSSIYIPSKMRFDGHPKGYWESENCLDREYTKSSQVSIRKTSNPYRVKFDIRDLCIYTIGIVVINR
jgi:hypothetical protein